MSRRNDPYAYSVAPWLRALFKKLGFKSAKEAREERRQAQREE